MSQKKYLKIVLIVTLVLVALGGFGLHSRIHPFTQNPANFIPFIAGLMSILVISTLFVFKKLVPYAYLANGMLAIIGTITMAHFSISRLLKEVTFMSIISGTLLPDISILWGSFFLGKALFELELTNPNNLDTARHKGRFFRYPNLGYWCVHLVTLGTIYTLGHILWK